MDIHNTGAAYLDDFRFSASSVGITNAVSRNDGPVSDNEKFAGLLKRAAPADPNTGAGKVSIDKTDKLYEQCLELEIFLVKNLISSMRNTVQKSGLVDEGFAGKMYEDMLYDEYARDFTRNANFGLAEQAYLELSGQRGRVLIRS
jgi:flagellar protein FlgJ